MKKRKSGFLQRMLAVLLAAVLVVSMASNDVSLTVLAQEDTETLTPDGQQENTEENKADTVEEDTEPEEEPETNPAEETNLAEETQNVGGRVKPETPMPDEETEEDTAEPDEVTEEEKPEPEEETEQEPAEETNPEEPEEITVDEAGQNVQALLERITALPEAEEYLATEPDTDDWAEADDAYEEAYTEWMEGLYEYAEEALAIQEAVAELSEEEQAEIPEEALAKLAAWAGVAQTAGESAQVMTAAEPAPQADNIASGTDWVLAADGRLTISSHDGMIGWMKSRNNVYNGTAFKLLVKSVELQSGVTTIGDAAFSECTGLAEISISNSVKIIGNSALEKCTSLTKITIPESVTGIWNSAFQGCSSLTEITIPKKVTSIESSVFQGCSSLKRITIPESVTSIWDSAFRECTSLTKITIPESVTGIWDSAFQGCSSLTEITIPEKVTSIGYYAFSNCSDLKTVTMLGENPPILRSRVFSNCGFVKGNTQGIHVPAGTVQAYKDAWTDWANYITDGTTAEKYTVTVNNGTGGGEYAAGDTVTITADAPASGKQFDKWVVNSGSVTLASATNSTTTFTMPAGAVSVTATYKDKTNSGGGDSGSGGNSGSSSDSGSGGNSGSSSDSGSGGNSGGNSDSDSDDDHSDTGNSDSGNNNDNNNGDFDIGNNDSGSGDSGSSVENGAAGGSQNGANVNNSVTAPAKAPVVVITTPSENLESAVLTEPERQQKADGADIRIELDVKAAVAEAGAADRAIVEEALRGSAAGYTLGQYLNINLYKVIGDSRTAITETAGKITVRIDVPESLRNTDGSRTRTFAVIRVHNGRAQLLADLDNDTDTITIETDLFSTYAIVYKDTAAGAGNTGSGNSGSIQLRAESGSSKESTGGKDDEPKTGDDTPLELSATLAMIAGFAYLLLYFTDRERGMTEERKKELVSRLVGWAKQGGRFRKYLALAAIFALLVYYHSIGKKTCTDWKAIYGE